MITEAIVCLALTVYFEARREPIAGQVAVAQVVLNRVADDRWPDDVCQVVFQGGEHTRYCQFSWYCDGRVDMPRDADAWVQAWYVADAVMHGSIHADLVGVTHYHADYVIPYWSHELRLASVIGAHKFYE